MTASPAHAPVSGCSWHGQHRLTLSFSRASAPGWGYGWHGHQGSSCWPAGGVGGQQAGSGIRSWDPPLGLTEASGPASQVSAWVLMTGVGEGWRCDRCWGRNGELAGNAQWLGPRRALTWGCGGLEWRISSGAVWAATCEPSLPAAQHPATHSHSGGSLCGGGHHSLCGHGVPTPTWPYSTLAPHAIGPPVLSLKVCLPGCTNHQVLHVSPCQEWAGGDEGIS